MWRHFIKLSAVLLAVLWIKGERGVLLRRSTRQFYREAGGWRGLLNGKFLHAYFYGRWPSQYIGWGIQYTFPLAKRTPDHDWWAPDYHGKVVRTADAKKLLTVNTPVKRDLEQIIPFPVARDLVLNGPPDIAVMECPCRAAREDPCQPTDVCMVVGQPFVDFVLEHNTNSARRLTTQEALDLLDAERARGHLHAAYFKDAMLNRFYAICNCCGCCCAGIEAMTKSHVPMVIGSGYVAQVDVMSCQGCGICEDACPFDAIHVEDVAEVVWENCMGCGICESQCTGGALVLVRDARKGEPLDVSALIDAGADEEPQR
jgi:NAD-dependent dihydropyrimidine dehydrogenase PreA subunit